MPSSGLKRRSLRLLPRFREIVRMGAFAMSSHEIRHLALRMSTSTSTNVKYSSLGILQHEHK
eukprot:2682920-Alexandrium_andersonii.AAC.1